MALLRTFIGISIAAGIAIACSSSTEDPGDGEENPLGNSDAFQTNGGIDQGSTSSALGSSSGSGGPTGGSNVDGCADPNLAGCVGSNYEGEGLPLAIYIMFDQSASMGCAIEASGPPWPRDCGVENPNARITPVREAVESFLNDRASAGISVGVGYFGYMPIGETSCNAADYSQAAVQIGRLPDNADTLIASINAVQPTGETPTDSAIQGACTYLQSWRDDNPGYKTVILLVTDGVPEAPSSQGCNPSIEAAEDVTGSCRDEGIDTYVLGVGQALDNLNRIADAGGTDQAHLVEGGDVSQAVLEALNAIRADATIPCTLPIPNPDSGQIDYNSVNIGICDSAENSLTTFYVDNADACTNEPGGWYYTDGGSTRDIQLCDATCDIVSSAGAKLHFTLGCQTITPEDIE